MLTCTSFPHSICSAVSAKFRIENKQDRQGKVFVYAS